MMGETRSFTGRRIIAFALLVTLPGTLFVFCGAEEKEKTEKIPAFAYVTGESASVRTDPLTTAAEIDTLVMGVKVAVLSRSAIKVRIAKFHEYWYLIKPADGIQGWVYGARLSIGNPVQKEMAGTGPEENLQKKIVGKWWEVKADGATGYRKIYFWTDGKYKYGYGSEFTKKGNYEILIHKKIILLDEGSGVGDQFTIHSIGGDLRLSAKARGRTYFFRIGDRDPESKEVGISE